MSLFQSSVLRRYLSTMKLQHSKAIQMAWKQFTEHFHHSDIQENIRNSKEEQYQEGFLDDLFVKIFGYVRNPTPKFNLTTEFKNLRDGKKADGAILKNGNAVAIIELKGTNTTDLGKVEAQAFGYKNNQPQCKYVITSNFEKIRFYIDNAVDFEEFNLFELQRKDFDILWLCLSAQNLLHDIPLKIKTESVSEDEKITKELYAHYAQFRREMFEDIVKRNSKYDKLTLFKKTQKLLDRFLFLYFSEDRGLLPPNSVRTIIRKWTDLKEEYDIEVPLYDRFKKYFAYMNTGYKDEVYPYNGGLFAPDEILDTIKVEDGILYKHTYQLSTYDYESEVSVTILGHIFEHSLNEIEEIQAQIQGISINKSKTKRKKDGVFYTPRYITKYIVENTIGKLCEEKKTELQIIEEDYEKERKGRKKTTLKKLQNKLQTYRDWLLKLTICDPACGSGAFLNQALEFLRAEHRYIDELNAKLLGSSLVLSDIDHTILENNLFGVDVNEESVEIAQLSLWLHTARRGRKLTTLSNNIKCGNSLIDDPKIAGEKAFDWEKEFPQIFEKGGFDVVIGNPPYGAELLEKKWLKEKYPETSFGNIDSYKYFIQLGQQILKIEGSFGYIIPDSYLEKEYFRDLRLFLNSHFGVITNVKLGDDIFQDVNLPTAIMLLKRQGNEAHNFNYLDISKHRIKDKSILLNNPPPFIKDCPEVEKALSVNKSIISTQNTVALIDVYSQVMGVKVYQKGKGDPKQTKYEKQNDVFVSKVQNEEFTYPFISQGIERYNYVNQNEYITYGKWLAEPRKLEYFDNPKIIVREIINPRIFAHYIEYSAVIKNIAAVIIEKNAKFPIKYLLGLINSKLFTYYVNEQSPKSGNKSYPSFNSRLIKNLPIADCSFSKKEQIINKANKMLLLNSDFQKVSSKFLKLLQSSFSMPKVSKKLQKWHELEFEGFLKELKKAKVKVSLADKSEWMDFFEAEKIKAQALQSKIQKVDSEIDQMVYQLYGLTEEEIKIVENAV